MSDFQINLVTRHLHYKDKSYRMNPYDSVETSIGDFIGKIVADTVREQEQRIKELEQIIEGFAAAEGFDPTQESITVRLPLVE